MYSLCIETISSRTSLLSFGFMPYPPIKLSFNKTHTGNPINGYGSSKTTIQSHSFATAKIFSLWIFVARFPIVITTLSTSFGLKGRKTSVIKGTSTLSEEHSNITILASSWRICLTFAHRACFFLFHTTPPQQSITLQVVYN